jgi:DNA gyrase inhibitor GyrI
MSTLKVRIERLPAMRVARTSVRSENPETDSIEKIMAWAKSRGITSELSPFRL